METTNLTELEIIGLKSITGSDFYEQGRGSITWDFSVFDICPLKGKTRSGVFSSLSQKGLISITEKEKPYTKDENGNKIRNPYYQRGDNDCNFGTIRITELGYEVLDSKNLINEYGEFI
jgi:hypothetical protein